MDDLGVLPFMEPPNCQRVIPKQSDFVPSNPPLNSDQFQFLGWTKTLSEKMHPDVDDYPTCSKVDSVLKLDVQSRVQAVHRSAISAPDPCWTRVGPMFEPNTFDSCAAGFFRSILSSCPVVPFYRNLTHIPKEKYPFSSLDPVFITSGKAAKTGARNHHDQSGIHSCSCRIWRPGRRRSMHKPLWRFPRMEVPPYHGFRENTWLNLGYHHVPSF